MQFDTKNFRLHFSSSSSFLLDIIRLFSAQYIVLVHHCTLWKYVEPHKLGMMKDIGAIALAGFFVHSGYLIAWSTFRRQKNEPLYGFREFFTDRLVRVYIALIPCMVVLVLVTLLGYALVQKPIAAVGLRDTIGTLLMLENNPLLEQMRYYFQSDDGSCLFVKNYAGALPLWTLVIEWWIYMAFGWWILVKQKRKWWYWPLLLFFLIEPAWQTFVGNRLGPGLPIF